MTATIQRLDVAQETEAENAFHESCQLGAISWPHHYRDENRPTCSTRISSLAWCTRTAGHVGRRHVASSDTTVVAASEPARSTSP
jgi:hypothetical protein